MGGRSVEVEKRMRERERGEGWRGRWTVDKNLMEERWHGVVNSSDG